MAKKSTMTEVLHLVFSNSSNKETVLKIANPKADLTRDRIEEVMISIIESSIFYWIEDSTVAKEAYIRRVYVDELVSIS
ncbi:MULTISPECIES: DUF2922 domain-containing protein [Enterococcaceae]|uniref:DUF2922 domain-containing protein n=1 Tax=Vagococcus luciliae TaxID=2920380 RepID=A0ABY5P2Q9_9ENTE|nr:MULTISPECIES: DUF2922 domain-containing protein [Enterococcaceae]RGI28480.1 DUF2922 domain-containing protein [Melissococcus sp. OM08-11BH]UUV99923.1 hypothetical protein G314FT_20920 [Vagococcus luciliae]